jgi:hypothetical protein
MSEYQYYEFLAVDRTFTAAGSTPWSRPGKPGPS